MSTKTQTSTSRKSGGAAASSKTATSQKKRDGGTRETFESIAIAFALAFLFKSFQAEAYVIPTGSMAPTLFGRHKEITCPSCRFQFQVGASSEVDDSSGALLPEGRLVQALCPNCRRDVDVRDAPVFNGDRIIVNKQVSGFDRFDVVVFKNPEEGHVNYIKRLVGLPGETIRIRQGNLWMRPAGTSDPWEMLCKQDPAVQRDIQLLVHDDQYPARDLLTAGWPERWGPARPITSVGRPSDWEDADNDWQADRETRRYQIDAAGTEWQWLRYRHFVADERDWDAVHNGTSPAPARASLISDYCGFNVAASSRDRRGLLSDAYWVGDLTLNCQLDIASTESDGAVQLELVEGPDIYRCTFSPETGEVAFSRVNYLVDRDGERPVVLAKTTCAVQGTGSWQVSFANVDNRLLLWVDGSLVDFGSDTRISQQFVNTAAMRPSSADTAPCGVAVRRARVSVGQLRIERDIYYRNDARSGDREDALSWQSYESMQRSQEVGQPWSLRQRLNDPEAWADQYQESTTHAQQEYGRYTEYTLADDEYLMLGDNSPRSKDSRLFDYYNRVRWNVDSHRYAVQEKDLIGKALFVFWPHGVPFLNGGEGFTVLNHKQYVPDPDTGEISLSPVSYPKIRFPFYPNYQRMKKIR